MKRKVGFQFLLSRRCCTGTQDDLPTNVTTSQRCCWTTSEHLHSPLSQTSKCHSHRPRQSCSAETFSCVCEPQIEVASIKAPHTISRCATDRACADIQRFLGAARSLEQRGVFHLQAGEGAALATTAGPPCASCPELISLGVYSVVDSLSSWRQITSRAGVQCLGVLLPAPEHFSLVSEFKKEAKTVARCGVEVWRLRVQRVRSVCVTKTKAYIFRCGV